MGSSQKHYGATLTDVDRKDKVTICTFLENGQQFKVSAFNDILDKSGVLLSPSQDYDFETEQYKEFTNFKAKWRGKEKVGIMLSLAGNAQPPQMGERAQPPQRAAPPVYRAPSPSAPPPSPQAFVSFVPKPNRSEERFEEIHKERPIQQRHMRAGGLGHDAAQIVSAIIRTGNLQCQLDEQAGVGKTTNAELAKAIEAEAYSVYINLKKKMLADSDIEEQAWQLGSLKVEKPADKPKAPPVGTKPLDDGIEASP